MLFDREEQGHSKFVGFDRVHCECADFESNFNTLLRKWSKL